MKPSRPQKSSSHPRSQSLYLLIRRVLGGGISDREISRRLGLDAKTLYKLKYGRSPVPRRERLKSIARALGLPEEELLAAVSQAKTPSPGVCSSFALPPPVSPEEFLSRCSFLFENMYDAVIVSDPAGRIVEWNPAAERLYGYSRRGMLGKSAEILNRPGEGRKLTREIMRAVEKQGRWSGQVRFVRKDGSEGITETVVLPVRDRRGKTLALVSFDRNITDRKWAEGEILKLNQYLDSVIDNASVWLDVLDEKARVVIWNKAAEEISGWKREEVTGHGRIWGRLYPDKKYRDEILSKARAIIVRGEEVADFETTIRTKSGESKIISWHSRNLLAPGGRPIGSIALGRDVTELARRAEALREADRKYREEAAGREKAQQDLRLFREMIDQSQDFISIIDLETGYFRYVNEATRRATGFSEKQWLSWRVADIDPTVSERWAARRERRRRRTRSVFVREGSLRRRTGDPIPVEIGSSIVSAGGKDYLVAIARDIGDRTRAMALIAAQRDLASALNSISRLEEGLRLCLETAIRIGEMDAGGLYLFAAAAGTFSLRNHTGLSPRFVRQVSFLPPESEKTRIILKGKPIYGCYDRMISRPSDAERKEGLKAIAVIPLPDRGKVIGCLNVASHAREEVPPDARAGLEGVAAQMGAAIVRLRNRDELEGVNRLLAQRTDALMRLNRCFLSLGTDPRRNIEIIVSATGEMLGADSALYVRRAPDGESHRIANAWNPPPGLEREINPCPGSLCSDVIASGKAAPLVIPDLRGTSYAKTDPHVAAYGLQSYLGFPIRLHKKTLGALCLCGGRPRAFTVEELKSAEILARGIAIEEERLRALENLSRSEEEYRRLVEGASDCVFSTDPKGTFLFANPATLRAADYTLSGLRKRTYLDLVLPEWRRRVQLHYMRQYLSRTPTSYIEYPFRAKDGRIVWFGQKASLKFENGEITGFDCISRDITGRKRAEKELQAAMERGRRQQECVAAVAVLPRLIAGDIPGLADQVTELAARAAGVARASVWLFDESGEKLRCVDLYEASAGRHTSGAVLERREYANEFDAFKTAKFVDAHDPLTDPRTAGYVEGYLKPLRIASMLDAAIRASGRTLGVVCLEHVDKPHHWGQDEIIFACQIADQIALAILSRERNRAEEALKASEGKYRELFESMTSAVAVYEAVEGGEDFIFRDFNRSGEKIDALKREELIGKKVSEIFPGVKKYGLFEIFQRVWRTGKAEQYPAAQYRDERISGWRDNYVYKLPTGEIVAIYEDVTEFKQAEEKLKDSEEKYRSLVETVNDVIFAVDEKGILTYISPAVQRLSGYRPDEAIGKPFADFIYQEDLPLGQKRFQGLLAGEFAPAEYRLKSKSGPPIWVRSSSRRFLADGRPAGIRGILSDITESKLSEERIRFQAQLLDCVTDSVVATDLETRIVYWGKGAERLYGYSAEEAMGQPYHDVAGSIEEEDEEAFQRNVIAQGFWRGEHVQRKRDGTVFRSSTLVSLVKDYAGRPCGFIGIDQDITESKRAEAELAQYREHLEELVNKRTAEYKKLINLMAGREVRMADLKKVIGKLREQLKSRGIEPEADDPLIAD